MILKDAIDHILSTHSSRQPAKPTLTTTQVKEAITNLIASYETRQSTKITLTIPQRQTLADISAWISGTPSTLDHTKGLYIYGPHGTGKTFITEIIRELYRWIPGIPYQWISYDDIYSSIRYNNNDEILKNLTYTQIIDDYAYQGRSLAKVYGNDDYVADLVISKLDRKISGRPHRCIITSNYDPDFLRDSAIIHPGTYSRIKGLFNLVPWKSDDHRING